MSVSLELNVLSSWFGEKCGLFLLSYTASVYKTKYKYMRRLKSMWLYNDCYRRKYFLSYLTDWFNDWNELLSPLVEFGCKESSAGLNDKLLGRTISWFSFSLLFVSWDIRLTLDLVLTAFLKKSSNHIITDDTEIRFLRRKSHRR